MAASAAIPGSGPGPFQPGLLPNLRFDLIAGFLVFLIAMPLCLAIAKASGFPPIAGIWTAVIGGVLTCFLSNANLTIKGPAAGLIVIVAGSVNDLGKEFVPALAPEVVSQLQADGKTAEQIAKELEFEQARIGHRLTLGVGVVAGVIQMFFGLLKAGKLGDFFPLSAVHGMLASIGIIIISKQLYAVLGIDPPKDAGPLGLLYALPGKLPSYNPEIAFIGILSLAILFGLPLLRLPLVRRVPAQLLVLLVAVPIGMSFDLEHEHVFLFHDGFFEAEDHEYKVGPRFLVDMPEVTRDPSAAFFLPDFRGVPTPTGLQYVAMFALIASLESLLSAKAVDLIDPWRRRTDMNRDLFACGVANTLTAAVGALPMISEIVRSKANVDNGARTKYANLFHALFLLGFVLAVPNLIHRIPLAALGAMLVYTGFRLAHPREFVHTLKIGVDQLVVFVSTILATLATDLLIGIGVGIAVKAVLHAARGVSPLRMFTTEVEIAEANDGHVVVAVRGAAVFSNWLALKPRLVEAARGRNLVIDLSETKLVDHSVMEKLHELEAEFAGTGHTVTVTGLDQHKPLSRHPLASRKRSGDFGSRSGERVVLPPA